MKKPDDSFQIQNSLQGLQGLLASLDQGTRDEIEKLVMDHTNPLWEPIPGPQAEAFTSGADILFYGGAAGGGKTDLAVGLATTAHKESIIFRKEVTQLVGIIERLTQLLGSRDGYNGQDKVWRLPDRRIEFGSCPNPGDEMKYQGRPHDLKVFDEITHFSEYEFRFLSGWLRSTDPDRNLNSYSEK